jgi:hypothetical protein
VRLNDRLRSTVAFDRDFSRQRQRVGENAREVRLRYQNDFRIREVEFNGLRFVESSHHPELARRHRGPRLDPARLRIVRLQN